MTREIKLIVRPRDNGIEIVPPPGIKLVIDAGPQDHDDMYTIGEAAQIHGISRNTLAKACDYGNLPSDLRGGLRFVKGADVVAWLKSPRKRGRPTGGRASKKS